ncbi:MAG: TIGR04076 family protein [Candidatus Bathyarchaeota archaeon]|nr:MAG: TIGR04076 family protein [Candidatus Bathyarchaeota archaeon]
MSRRQLGDFMVRVGKVKITVLRKLHPEEIFEGSLPLGESSEPCKMLRAKQEFVVGEDGRMSEGFCHWAWNAIFHFVFALRTGGSSSGTKDDKTSIIGCCNDGLRPSHIQT